MTNKILLYGCYGYTGSLVASKLKESNLSKSCILAGRDKNQIIRLQQTLNTHGKEFAGSLVFSVTENRENLIQKLKNENICLLVNCAGPFQYTAKHLIEVCIECGIHYMDCCSDVHVIQEIYSYQISQRALAKNVILMVGLGVDTIIDAVATKLRQVVDDPKEMDVMVKFCSPSIGTVLTILTMLPTNCEFRDGKLIKKWYANEVKSVIGDHKAIAFPIGNLGTLGIPNVRSFTSLPFADTVAKWDILNWLLMFYLFWFSWQIWLVFHIPLLNTLLIWMLTRVLKLTYQNPTRQKLDLDQLKVLVKLKSSNGDVITGKAVTIHPNKLVAELMIKAIKEIYIGNIQERGVMSALSAFGIKCVEEIKGCEVTIVNKKIRDLVNKVSSLQNKLGEFHQNYSIALGNRDDFYKSHQEELANVNKQLQHLQASEKQKDQRIFSLEQQLVKKQETINELTKSSQMKHSNALQLENEQIASKRSNSRGYSVEGNGQKKKRKNSAKKNK